MISKYEKNSKVQINLKNHRCLQSSTDLFEILNYQVSPISSLGLALHMFAVGMGAIFSCMAIFNSIEPLHALAINLDNNIPVTINPMDMNALIQGLSDVDSEISLALRRLDSTVNLLRNRLDQTTNYYTIQELHTVSSSLTRTLYNGLVYLIDLRNQLHLVPGGQPLIDMLHTTITNIIDTCRPLVELIRRYEACMRIGDIPNIRNMPFLVYIDVTDIQRLIILNAERMRLLH